MLRVLTELPSMLAHDKRQERVGVGGLKGIL